MNQESGQKSAMIVAFVVIAIAVTGYFTGLQSPMNPMKMFRGDTASSEPIPHAELLHPGGSDEASPSTQLDDKSDPQHLGGASNSQPRTDAVIPATHYSQMHEATKKIKANYRTSLADLHRDLDPLSEIKITSDQKAFALALREKNRAFNGAPPTIPHAVEQISAESCMACHGEGFKSESLRISKMSHQFLTNCTQCHVETNPQHMQATLFRENTFVGLPAPTGGPRAYEGAPPMIPHSTWMRVNCMSCHGFASEQGIRTTHPWRQNCQQCHAPSSELDQILLDPEPKFLRPPKVNR